MFSLAHQDQETKNRILEMCYKAPDELSPQQVRQALNLLHQMSSFQISMRDLAHEVPFEVGHLRSWSGFPLESLPPEVATWSRRMEENLHYKGAIRIFTTRLPWLWTTPRM